jgi:SAM-dependent methyltransferase
MHLWKAPHIAKGALTWLPILNAWRIRRQSIGGSDSPRYCYSVWLRHLTVLHRHGFTVTDAQIGELGPGDSIGIGLAAILSGATRYVGLDIVPFPANADLKDIFDELIELYLRRARIPDNKEFPLVRPMLESYDFPNHLVSWIGFHDRVQQVREDFRGRWNSGQMIQYKAPWTSVDDIAVGTLDLIFSQAVLEHVDSLSDTYRSMFAWLKPGGYGSHIVDFNSHGRSPFWNGHWAYSETEWNLVRGCREFLLNREPLETHLARASEAGFRVLRLLREYDYSGLPREGLSPRFRTINANDARTRGAMLLLYKPYK